MRQARATLVAILTLAFAGVAASTAYADNAKEIYKKTLAGTIQIQTPHGSGSGWLIDADQKLFVTNEHVVTDNKKVYIFFPIYENKRVVAERSRYKDERGYLAKVVDTDEYRDLAIIQLQGRLPAGVKALSLAKESASPGDEVHSVGNPGASGALWVYTSGTVRQVYDKNWNIPDSRRRRLIKHRAKILETQSPLNPGDSGGPIVNDNGEVVGVVQGGKIKRGDQPVNLLSWGIELSEVKSYLAQTRRLMQPTSEKDYYLLGYRLELRGMHDEAIDAYTTAIRLKRDFAAAYRERGKSFYRKGDSDTAMADLEDAMKHNRLDSDTFRWRAIIHKKKKDYDKALADYTKAIQLDPDNANAYNERGNIYLDVKNDLDKAFSDYNRTIEADPNFVHGYYNRGLVQYRAKNYDKAIADMHRALDLYPYYNSALNVLGLSAQHKGDHATAVKYLSIACKLSPKSSLYHTNLGDAYRRQKKWKEAFTYLDKSVELDSRYARGYYVRGLANETYGTFGRNIRNAHKDFEKSLHLQKSYSKSVKRRYKSYLILANLRKEPVRVNLQYEYLTKKGWLWYPNAPGGANARAITLKPGQVTALFDDDWKVRGRRIGISAQGTKTNYRDTANKNRAIWICPQDGYLATKELEYIYVFE